MTDLRIDYNLSVSEMLLFPFCPMYGLRHLEKEGWENKIIGVIELFPGIGPIAALIEGIVHAFFHKEEEGVADSSKKSLKEKSQPPQEKTEESSSLDKKTVKDKVDGKTTGSTQKVAIGKIKEKRAETWQEAFKQKTLEHFHQVQTHGRAKKALPVLDLTPEQQSKLEKVAYEACIRHPSNVEKLATLHGANDDWVFSLEEIPGWIFKSIPEDWNTPLENSRMLQRQKATQKAQEVVEQENLTFLHVPAQQILAFDKPNGDGKYYVLAEQKCEILGSFEKQNALFHYCTHDEDLKPVMKEYVRQLVILILKTNYADVRADNNPLLINGQGIALIDMDDEGSPVQGLRTGQAGTGEDGLLWSLTPELIESIEPLLQASLTKEVYDNLHLPEIKAIQKQREAQNAKFLDFLTTRKVKTGREPVKWQWMRFPWDSPEDNYIRDVQERVNSTASRNFGKAFALPEERKFYFCEAPTPQIEQALTRLKKEGKIFDWVRPQDFSKTVRAGNGYYLWC